jgi:hypothetical protein
MDSQEPSEQPAAQAAGLPALDFMVGEWDLDYTVTQRGVTSSTIDGTGSIRPLFGGAYLTFDYVVVNKDTREELGGAHAILAWDAKAGQYRFFWFESSRTFLQATGALADDCTLALEWQGVNCTQIFRRVDDYAMYLEMRCPDDDLLLHVDFTRRDEALVDAAGRPAAP